GRVTCSFRTLGNEAFTDRAEARGVVSAAAETGLLEVESLSEAEASVRFPAFRRWQDAGRKAKERESRKSSPEANVRTRPKVSEPVPTDKTDQTRQTDKTDREEKTSGKPSEFDSWLADYRMVTGRESLRGSKP